MIPAKGSIFKKVKKNAALENLESGAAKGREAAPRKKEGKIIYSIAAPVSVAGP